MTRGGKRKDAGRPPLEDPAEKRITGSITLKASEWAALDTLALELELPGRGPVVSALLAARPRKKTTKRQKAPEGD
jgi:hypothetical protein